MKFLELYQTFIIAYIILEILILPYLAELTA